MTKTPSPHHPITETRPHPVHWPSRGSGQRKELPGVRRQGKPWGIWCLGGLGYPSVSSNMAGKSPKWPLKWKNHPEMMGFSASRPLSLTLKNLGSLEDCSI